MVREGATQIVNFEDDPLLVEQLRRLRTEQEKEGGKDSGKKHTDRGLSTAQVFS